MLELSFGELTGVYGVDNATSELERVALPDTEPAAGPTSVNEPADGSSRTHAFCETVGRKLTSIVDNEIGFTKASELLFCRVNKCVMLK